MAGIVVPFRGIAGKQRLTGLAESTHRAVVLGMLSDVLAATTVVGRTVVVTSDQDGLRVAIGAGAEVPAGFPAAQTAATVGTSTRCASSTSLVA